jgi:hypothetical protein
MTPAARRSAVAGLAAAAGLGTTAAAAGIGTTAAAAAGGAALLPAVVGFTGGALLWSARQMAAAAQGTAHVAMNAALFLPRTALWAAGGMMGSAQAPATPAVADTTAAAAAPAARSAMPQLPPWTAAKGAAGGAAVTAPAASVAVTVTAAPGGLSMLGVLRLMVWQLPWSVAVATLTAWGWLLSQLVVAPAGMLFNYATTQRSTPAVTYTAGAAPATSSVLTGTAEGGQAEQAATSWPSSAAANGVPGGAAVTFTGSASSGAQDAGGGGGEALVEQVEAESPRVGSMRWLPRGRTTGQVPPTPSPSLEVRGGKRWTTDVQSAATSCRRIVVCSWTCIAV